MTNRFVRAFRGVVALVTACVAVGVASEARAQSVIAGWDFQTTASGGTAAAVAPNSPTSFAANLGSGTLYLNGTNGSST